MISPDNQSIAVLSLLWALFCGGVAWYSAQILRHVTYVTLADGRRQERLLPPLFRLLLPLAPNLTPFFRRASYAARRELIAGRIVSAGFAGLITSEEFLALRILMPALPGLLCVAAAWMVFSVTEGRLGAALARHQIPLFLAILLAFFVYPDRWLRRALARRHRSIQRALPFVLDLLTLSVEAGLDFMSAIQRIVDRRSMDAIGEEFVQVLREIQLGKTRRDALRDMVLRVDQPDVRVAVNALVQADELGVGIATVLRIQSDQMRSRRFERAERLANEAPVKMLFPLIAFIFPAVFLILLGPIVLQIFRYL